VYPDKGPALDIDPSVVCAPNSGVVVRIGHDKLIELAVRERCCLELVPAVGQFVPAGSPLLRVHGTTDFRSRDKAALAIDLELERTLEHDPAYGFRLLVDIAERSISQSPFEDPTTAVQAIDRLHDCLRQLAQRPIPDGIHRDDHGEVRLVVPSMDWDAYVRLAFEEIRLAGTRSPQVTRRLEAALRDLLHVAPPDRRPALLRELQLLEAEVADATSEDDVRAFALEPDSEGIGARSVSKPKA
jgi:uncharacterized membrane protein